MVIPSPCGRPILPEEDEGDREILSIRKPIRGGSWSLCTSASMLYQLSHATIFIEPNKYIIARLPGVVNTFFHILACLREILGAEFG